MTQGTPTLVGRSSSHFTRVTRIFAAEFGVEYSFQVVPDLSSIDPADYGGHVGLKVPTLRTSEGLWFGALNICREFARRASLSRITVWPEALATPLLASAQELVLQAMSTEVSLVMGKASGVSESNPHQLKMTKSLLGMLAWLELHAEPALAALPPSRDLSYLEVTLFCLVTHLEFREVLLVDPYPRLTRFRDGFAERASSAATSYRFDP
jgi:hypothetical protein